MIKLVFTLHRDTTIITIENKIITYKDKRYPQGFRCIPKDPNLKKIVLFSRNKIPKEIIKFVEDANSGKNIEEYNSAKNDEELVPIIIRDAELNGMVFQGRGE